MTESMIVAVQVICAAGVFFLSALTLTGRFAKALREEMRAGHDALREEMREGLQSQSDRIDALREEMRSDLLSVSGKTDALREEMRTDRDTLREEMRADRAAIFGEINELRLEMHEMNGRLGRVEGHLGISASKSYGGTQ